MFNFQLDVHTLKSHQNNVNKLHLVVGKYTKTQTVYSVIDFFFEEEVNVEKKKSALNRTLKQIVRIFKK